MSPPIYRHITTPIFYPNASPHLGHLYSSLLADVQHRWNRLQLYNSKFTTGTDEHGLKIQQAATKNGYADPLKFVDTLTPKFKSLDSQYDIDYTNFIRTTDIKHVENVKKLWEKCHQNGHIYKDVHQGWYSVSDETFYPESKIVKFENDDKSVKYINTETNNEVTYHKETNYFFKLSDFQDQLIELHSREGSNAWIFPESKRLTLLNELMSRDLSDLSISRPSKRLSWAIPVPNDSTQSIYVWFDALTNYISSLGPLDNLYDNNNNNINTMPDYWSQTTHIIGKDIMKFHCWYWPSFLLSAGLPLPKRIVIHDHWLSQGVKMSKSLGNVVDPMKLPSQYGKDIIRWSILENSQLNHDNNFKYGDLVKCRNIFISKWGNLINRCCNAKSKFNLLRAVNETCGNISSKDEFLDIWQDQSLSSVENEQMDSVFKQLESLQETYSVKMETFQYNHIIKAIWQLIDQLNLFIQITKPWDKTITNQVRQDAIIFLTMDVSRVLSILTQPMIPQLSNRFLDRIGVSPERRSFKDAEFGVDHTYGINVNDSSKSVPIERKVASYEY